MKKPSFLLTDFALKNRTSIFVLMTLIFVFGLLSFSSLPKEDNPDIKIPYIFVNTVYPGVSPTDIETLVTKPIEKELKSLTDVKRVSSTSYEGFSAIAIEFNPDIEVDSALQRVRDKVNISRSELPEDAEDPVVQELSFESMPALIISMYGEKDLVALKNVAEKLQDEIDGVKGILDTKIVGGLEKEIRVIVDSYKLDHYALKLNDIINTLSQENVTIPGGKLTIGDTEYLVRVPGEFSIVNEIPHLILDTKSAPVYLRDMATLEDDYKKQETLSRYKTLPSVSIVVTRRAGENLIELSKNIHAILENYPFPKDVKLAVIGDRSEQIESMVNELTNSILTGVLLVVFVLLFFLGKRNATFVGIAIPLSMLMSFIVIETIGFTLNMVVLFSLILALGMLVDNGIVIVENIYRHKEEGKSNLEAARIGTAEVAWPVIGSTATTLAAFLPMVFWPGTMGEFMRYLPLTLIIALTSSLFVALVITPVFCAVLMTKDKKAKEFNPEKSLSGYKTILENLVLPGKQPSPLKSRLIYIGSLVGFFTLYQIFSHAGATHIEYALHLSRLETLLKIADKFGPTFFFGTSALVTMVGVVRSAFKPIKSLWYACILFVVLGLVTVPLLDGVYGYIRLGVGLLFLSVLYQGFKNLQVAPTSFVRRVMLITSFVMLFFASTATVGNLDVLFFPRITPERIMVQLEMQEGTDLEKTNEVISRVEAIVHELAQKTPTNIRHFVTSVGSKSGNGFSAENETTSVAEISIDFYKGEIRKKIAKEHKVSYKSLDPFLTIEMLRDQLKHISGGKLAIVEEQGGPPSGRPVTIEIAGDDFDVLRKLNAQIMAIVSSVEGAINVENNLASGAPEIQIEIDRDKAALLGVNTFAIANTIRTAVNGSKASVFREGDDEIDIVVKLDASQSNNLNILKYLVISGKDDKRIPLSQIASIKTSDGVGSITRNDFKRVAFVYADISQESKRTATDIIQEIQKELNPIQIPKGYTVTFAGEQEEQQESMAFLARAFMLAVSMIGMILISQFNSLVMPFIILFSVVLSFIGVVAGFFLAPIFFAFSLTPSPFIVIMTGVGIVSLAGVVVNNAIVLIDYINQLRKGGMEKNQAIVHAGLVRFRPVVLTAVTTILGLIPMSLGVSLDFVNRAFGVIPTIITGSSSSEWWAPLSNAVIFGLLVATVLTLVMVPVFYSALVSNKPIVDAEE